MELNQIRYAYHVAKYRSFSQAASHLFVTQPTLSQQVHKLEEDLGYPLFVRSTRSVYLTKEGEIFFKKAQPLLELYDNFVNDMYGLREIGTLSLTVGLLPTFLDFNMPEFIESFQANNEDISSTFEVQPSEELIKRLLARKYDAIIAYITSTQIDNYKKEFDFQILNSDHINVALHKKHPLSQRTTISLDDLRGVDLFMLEKKSAIEREIQTLLQQHEIVPKRIKTSPAFRSMLGSVSMNQGVCFHSSSVGTEYIKEPLRSIPLSPDVTMFTALMYLKESSNITAIQRFYNHVALNIEKLPR